MVEKKPSTHNPKAIKYIDHAKTIDLHNQGVCNADIARIQGCDRSNISRVLQRYGINQAKLKDYKNNRADVLAGIQERLLVSITSKDISKTPAIQRITGAAILYDKERLERNQATEITEIREISMSFSAALNAVRQSNNH